MQTTLTLALYHRTELFATVQRKVLITVACLYFYCQQTTFRKGVNNMIQKDFTLPESIQEMFPKDYILPESIHTRLLDDKTVYVKSVMAHYWENQEDFMYEGIPTNRDPESHGEYYRIELKSNIPGYVLTSLLNIDFDSVTEIISTLKLEESADGPYPVPINYEEIYERLLSLSDVFSLYLPNEWYTWQCDLATKDEGVSGTIAMLKKYIAFCNRRQLPYNDQFFSFLFSNGFFLIDPTVIIPAEKMSSLGGLFDNGGWCVDDLDEIYDTFLHGFDPNAIDSNCYLFGPDDRLQAIAMVSFNELAIRGKTIRQCKNCGKYFIPSKRSDTLYCDNPSPEAPEMTCKEYGTRRLWYEKQKEDELATLSRNIASAKGMLAKRNPDRPKFAASYEYFKAKRLIWKKAVEEGQKTKEEYREWLLLMQSQKIIKEAVQSCNQEDM